MSEHHEIIQIFVASPGGLDDERRAVSEIVEETNRRNGSHWRLQFKAIGWEDTVGGNRRAQDIINRDLETCDYFFGILADHWGSPPQAESDAATKYTSGFQEEYELAQELFAAGKMKDILLFFKKIPEDRLRDIGPSLQQALTFRKKVQEDRRPLYAEFDALETFRKKIGDALSQIGWDIVTPKVSRQIVAPTVGRAREVSTNSDSPSNTTGYFLTDEARDFLNHIRNKKGQPNNVRSVDVARLRLVATGMRQPGNDEFYVGVHDANLLFLHRTELKLSDVERRTLLTAGLGYMENQNVPFWYWTGGDLGKTEQFIGFRMLIGDENVMSAALKVATIFGYEILKFPKSPDPGIGIKRWFSSEQAYRLHRAALTYLSIWAKEEHVPAIQEIRDNVSGSQASELDCIVVGVRTRASRVAGMNELIKRNPEFVSAHLEGVLRDAIGQISTELLYELIKLKAAGVRLVSTMELVRRRALSEEVAQELSADNFVDVRFEAIKSLSDMAVPFSEDRARTALTVTTSRRGLGGLLGSGSSINDTSKFEEYQRHLLKKKSFRELLEIENRESPFGSDALLTAFSKFPRKMTAAIRTMLADGFEGRFEHRLRQLEARRPMASSEFSKTAQEVKEFCCLRQTQSALDLLAKRLKAEDLCLVRQVVDRWEIEASQEILAYFCQYGGWEDVERVLKLKEPGGSEYTALVQVRSKHDRLIGKTLFKIGGVRIVDLLDKLDTHKTRAAVLGACTQKCVSELSDEKILELLNDANDFVRKTMVLRCLEALSKGRLRILFDAYTLGDEFRYYNVIHWLDLGVVMPKNFVRRVVKNELETL